MKKTLLTLLSFILGGFVFAQNDCADLFISEVIEGSGNNKAIEIYNPTSQPIDLANYVVKRYSNGSTSASAGYVTDLIGVIQPGDVFVLVNGQTEDNDISPACDPVLQVMADQLDGDYPAPMYANGNDAITLEKKNGDIVDIFGKIGEDPISGWYDQDSTNYVAGDYWWLAWTANHTLIRKFEVKSGWPYNPGSIPGLPPYFMVHVEWDTVPRYLNAVTDSWYDNWEYIGWHECECHPGSTEEMKPVKASATFFPNPLTGNTITIKASQKIQSVEIINMIGQSVFTLHNPVMDAEMKVKLESVEKGMYLLKINLNGDNSLIQKLLVK